jgi:hypothetical protein
MEALEFLFHLIVMWRVGLPVLAAGLIALILASLIPGFGAAAGIVAVLLGLGAGMLWQIGYERSKHERSPPPQQ